MNDKDIQPSELSLLLKRCAEGDSDAETLVYEAAYAQLKRIARAVFRGGRHLPVLQPSMLVNEAFLRMPRAGEIDWKDRQHFFALAARAMRRTVVDHARQQAAAKRPKRALSTELDLDAHLPFSEEPETLILVDQALKELMEVDPRRGRVVEMRFFGGMTHEEAAQVLGTDPRTTKRDWQVAKLWLYDRITRSPSRGAKA